MQTLQTIGFTIVACGAVLLVLPRILRIRGRHRLLLGRASFATLTLGLVLIIGPLIVGLIGHAILYPQG
jgi:hypothetical protein